VAFSMKRSIQGPAIVPRPTVILTLWTDTLNEKSEVDIRLVGSVNGD